jgi:hypothetical protein
LPENRNYQDSNPQYDGQLKVGYTTRTARERLDDIDNIKTPGTNRLKNGTGSEPLDANPLKNTPCEVPVPLFQHTAKPYKIVLEESAMRHAETGC